MADDYTNPAGHPGMVGEAAKAVVGRVFGVEGDPADIQYHVIELNHHSPLSSTLRSAVLPGWGQSFNRQNTKGVLVFFGFIATAGAAVYTYRRSNNAYDDYRSKGLKNDASYDDYKNYRTQALIMGSAAGLIWAFSIFDAYHNAYRPLYSAKDTSVELAAVPGEASVVVKHAF